MSNKDKSTAKEAYWLPAYGKTVEASSYEEAVKKAKETEVNHAV